MSAEKASPMAEVLKLFNSLTRRRETLSSGGRPFGLYCCGPTVYNFAHVGNFRTFVVVDIVYRLLKLLDYKPFYVRNITDVDDKTIAGAREKGLPLERFTAHWTEVFRKDCRSLNLLPPDLEPRATDHIPEQIALIQNLLEKGYAYEQSGSIYFAIGRWKSYGRLSNGPSSGRRSTNPTPLEKEDGEDFVLWKARKDSDGTVFWDSPFGPGRPGWHTECGAMALKYLGDGLDLHCGGVDLCFPHHENEMAQSEAMTGSPFAKHWLHVAHLRISGEKMSKSLGNLYTVEDLQRLGYDGQTVRHAIIGAHYRRPLNFSLPSLDAARAALRKLQAFEHQLIEVADVDPEILEPAVSPDGFGSAWQLILDDLNIPAAMGTIFDHLRNLSRTTLSPAEARGELAQWIGLKFALGLSFSREKSTVEVAPESVRRLADRRLAARGERNFALADRLRSELADLGWAIEDRADGYDLSRTNGPADG